MWDVFKWNGGETERKTKRQTDRDIFRWNKGQAERQIDRHKYLQMKWKTNGKIKIERKRKTYGQRNKGQIERKTERHTDRQREIPWNEMEAKHKERQTNRNIAKDIFNWNGGEINRKTDRQREISWNEIK